MMHGQENIKLSNNTYKIPSSEGIRILASALGIPTYKPPAT